MSWENYLPHANFNLPVQVELGEVYGISLVGQHEEPPALAVKETCESDSFDSHFQRWKQA